MDNHERFNQYTEQLRKAFPKWTKIYKDKHSIGTQFLSVIGMTLEEMDWTMNYALQQRYIGTSDLSAKDIVYKTKLPATLKIRSNFRLMGENHILEHAKDEVEFLQIQKDHDPIFYNSICFVDYENKYIYVNYPYDKNEEYQNGFIYLSIMNSRRDVIHEERLPLEMHHVWNFFDELGLMLHLPRLYGETNSKYKQRLLDVFKKPAGSHKQGLMNGIARELGISHHVKWVDGSESLILKEPRIDLDSITVDDRPFPQHNVIYDDSGRAVLLGNNLFANQERTVSYHAGIELHQLSDDENYAFQSALHEIDGTATPLLQYYVDTIKERVPIMWGQWRWNQGFWDVADYKTTGFGQLPHVMDSNFTAWSKYR